MNRSILKQQIQELNYSTQKIVNKYLEEIAKIAVLNIDTKIHAPKEISELFTKCLEEVYKNTSSKLRDIYPKVKKFEIKNILTLTYQDDGKTLDQRIQSYWDDAIDKLTQNNRQAILISLIDKYNILLSNESLIVQSHIIKNKIAPVASILIIEGSEGDCTHDLCSDYIGEWPANEDIPLPPYHPSCTCFYYYVETNDIDDITDLDLDVER